MGYIMNLESIAKAKGWIPETTEESSQPQSNIQKQESAQKAKKKLEVPIWHKANLTLEEAAAYFGIGINKLREMTDEKGCLFVLFIGRKRLVKRRKFEEYLSERCVI